MDMVVDTMELPEEEVDFQQGDTAVAHQVDMEAAAVDSRSEDQEDQEVGGHPQEGVSQPDQVEAGMVVEDSRSVDLVAVAEVVAVVHRLLSEGYIPYPHLVRMTIHSTASRTSRRTRTTSRLKTGRTGSGVCVTYCMPRGWSKC